MDHGKPSSFVAPKYLGPVILTTEKAEMLWIMLWDSSPARELCFSDPCRYWTFLKCEEVESRLFPSG